MKNVKCKHCGRYTNEWCKSVVDSPDPDLERDCQYFIYNTIYNLIQKMDIDQLAVFLVENGWDCNNCSECERLSDNPFARNEKCDEECDLHCKEWLSKKIEND